MPSDPHSNQVLASLSDPDFAALRPHLRTIDLIYESVLVESGAPVTRACFPHSGIISLVVRLSEGEAVEAAMIGRDGVFGAAAAMDGHAAPAAAIVQLAGKASMVDAIMLRSVAEQSVTLRGSLVRYEQTTYLQAFQSAACNASHSAQARLARWLLHAHDLADSDTLRFSQEGLAQMLGAHRNSVSIIAGVLREAGLIRYSRGQIEIIDLQGLERNACECYGTLKTRSAPDADEA